MSAYLEMHQQPAVKKPAATAAGVASLLGLMFAVLAVAAAGIGGWFAVDRYNIALPESMQSSGGATELPALGDGLPSTQLRASTPWRSFALTYQVGDQTDRYWIDLDTWQVKFESSQTDATTGFELAGGRGFAMDTDGASWTQMDAEHTETLSRMALVGAGPFLLTELLPPNTVGFTTLELEGTSRGVRVYEVEVDGDTLRAQHPLAHDRWVNTSRFVADHDDLSGLYRIRVRDDGYVIRIDTDGASVQWDDLPDGVAFVSPLAEELNSAATATVDPDAPNVATGAVAADSALPGVAATQD